MWWRDAVVYQVYVRSFADTDGDGLGDLPGVRSRLPYLHDLGVDALWLTPFYPTPDADHGYDIADHSAVDPRFGTLADIDGLVDDAHDLGLRVLIDLVPQPHVERPPVVPPGAGGPGTPGPQALRVLSLVRAALAHRPTGPAFAWRPAPHGALAFDRGDLTCVVNVTADAVELPPGRVVVASGGPTAGRVLPPDAAAWVRRPG